MRDAESNPMPNRSSTSRSTYGTAPGNPLLYSETQSVVTNDGLFALRSVAVPAGSSGHAAQPDVLPFDGGVADIDGTGVLTSMGTEEFLSVPTPCIAAHSSNVPDGTEVGQVMHWDGGEWWPTADCTWWEAVRHRHHAAGSTVVIEATVRGGRSVHQQFENLGSNKQLGLQQAPLPARVSSAGVFSNVPNSGTAVPSLPGGQHRSSWHRNHCNP
ncbi:MAG: hypothetical protein H6594_10215 [Flavobacteriales bacterium]|nr:hypothetical protein [Flavobacteriales bacterium]